VVAARPATSWWVSRSSNKTLKSSFTSVLGRDGGRILGGEKTGFHFAFEQKNEGQRHQPKRPPRCFDLSS
jgi:hypothetical protein